MNRLWQRLFSKPAPAPTEASGALQGVPAAKRIKRYTAMSGYVYEYCYEGYRESHSAREQVFSVSGDRKTWFVLAVYVPHAALSAWEQENERELLPAERYAVAKLALFAAFDERESPAAMRDAVHVSASQVAELLASIDI